MIHGVIAVRRLRVGLTHTVLVSVILREHEEWDLEGPYEAKGEG